MVRAEIKHCIFKAVQKKYGGIAVPEFSVEPPDNPENGDYATNVAFLLARGLKKKPLDIAQELCLELNLDKNLDIFKQAVAAAPGFINLLLSDKVLYEELGKILKKKEKYGRGKKKKEKINVEFVSANPTGPLTMANARGGFYGDVLANVLEKTGHTVTREYYINDAGNQIRLLGESIRAMEGETPPKEEYYKGEYIRKLAGKSAKEAVKILLRDIKTSLKKAGITFDVWFSEEKNLRKTGEFEKTLKAFETKGLVKKKGGAVWWGDRVFVKSSGGPTYLLVDMAYLRNKILGRKFDKAVIVVGADHHAEMVQVKKGATFLGVPEKKVQVVIIQLIRLVRGGKEIRMGKRTGEFITMDYLIGEVGLDVARYFFLEKSSDTHMDFDMDLARERSVKNPVYYIQYAYVRCRSILQKAQSTKSKAQIKRKTQSTNLLNTTEEINLTKKLIQFPEIVEDTANDYQVHRLTRYVYELARSFHHFYEKHHVITDNKELTAARLELVRAAKIVLQNTLGLLGISAPERM